MYLQFCEYFLWIWEIGREITTLLKVAVESVTLDLCGSRDYFDRKLI